MHAYLHCLSHSPLVGYVDPAQEVLDEVNGVIASARERIAASPLNWWCCLRQITTTAFSMT